MDPAETGPAETSPAETPAAPSSPEGSAPSAPQEAAPVENVPGWFREYHERTSAELANYRQEFQRAQQEAQQQREWLLRSLDPEGYKAKTAPKYVTQEDFAREMDRRLSSMREESRTQMLMDSFQTEYSAAIAPHSDLAKAIGEARFEAMVIDEWGRNPRKSVGQIVGELDQAFQREFERRQASWSQGKQHLAQQTKAPNGKGSPPPPASNKAKSIREAAAAADFSQFS